MFYGDDEVDRRDLKSIFSRIQLKDLSGTVAQKEPLMTSDAVAGELEALPKAARPYPERIVNGNTAAPGRAVSPRQVGDGRDMQDPTPSSLGGRRWPHSCRQARQQK